MSNCIEVRKYGCTLYLKKGALWPVGACVKLDRTSFVLENSDRYGLHVVAYSHRGKFLYRYRLIYNGKYRLGHSYGYKVVSHEDEYEYFLRVFSEVGVHPRDLRNFRSGNYVMFSDVCPVVSSESVANILYSYGRIIRGWNRFDFTWFADILSPVTQDGEICEYLQAIQDEYVAKNWITKHFNIRSDLSRGDRILVNGREFLLFLDKRQEPIALQCLVRIHGPCVVEGALGCMQRMFIYAMVDIEEAVRFVTTAYKVVPALCKGRKSVRFGLLFGSSGFGEPGSFNLGAGEERQLRLLLDRYRGLPGVLFDELNAMEDPSRLQRL